MILGRMSPRKITAKDQRQTVESHIESARRPVLEQEHTEYACKTCRQRKIKCDRLNPCSNCIRNKTTCIPANYSGRRKRSSTKALYRCIHDYQRLLRKHKIKFKDVASFYDKKNSGDDEEDEVDSFHTPIDTPGDGASRKEGTGKDGLSAGDEGQMSFSDFAMASEKPKNNGQPTTAPEPSYPSSFRKAMTVNFDDFVYNDESLLFGPRRTRVSLDFHPSASQIFRLWHIYLDRIDPLLKITHTSTLQTQLFESLGDVHAGLEPNLEALLYSIYAVSIFSLKDHECQAMFDASQVQLLSKYQYCSQQALMNAGFMRTNSRMCLTAFFLYLMSMRFIAEARSLWSMSGLAIRIAQRIGLDDESRLKVFGPFKAEMGRRLWWALVAFDHQISAQAGTGKSILNAAWCCEPIHALNDWELRLEMGSLAMVQDKSSEALFAVARSEMEHYAHTGADMEKLRCRLTTRVFDHCNTVDPLHLMTTWWTRGAIAKAALAQLPPQKSGFEHACEVLETDALLMGTASTQKFHWFSISNSPLPVYIYLLRSMTTDFDRGRFEKAWTLMYENHILRRGTICGQGHLKIFSDLIMSGWSDIQQGWQREGRALETPRLVLMLQNAPIG